MAEVAAAFGSSVTSVHRLLVALGVDRRAHTEANSLLWKPTVKEKRRQFLQGKPSGATGKRWKFDRPIHRPRLRGAGNGAWKGGRVAPIAAIRALPEYRLWRGRVFLRGRHTCVLCGSKAGGVVGRIVLNADHIMSLAQLLKQHNILSTDDARSCAFLWDDANGRTLCHPCHRLTDTYGKNLGGRADV